MDNGPIAAQRWAGMTLGEKLLAIDSSLALAVELLNGDALDDPERQHIDARIRSLVRARRMILDRLQYEQRRARPMGSDSAGSGGLH